MRSAGSYPLATVKWLVQGIVVGLGGPSLVCPSLVRAPVGPESLWRDDMRAASCAWILTTLAMTVACSGKSRPFAEDPLEGAAGAAPEALPTAAAPPSRPSQPPPRPDTNPAFEAQPPANSLDTSGASLPDNAVSPSCDAGSCGRDAAPPEPTCVATGPRDCSSELDNDCDGRPDNTLDDVCRCVAGATEACEEHPGLDGRGQCRAGSRMCIAADGNASSDWGACAGSQGPGQADSCAPGDDADCDGNLNEGCACVDGFTQQCGPASNQGRCEFGVQTCVGGGLGDCTGAVFPSGRNCASPDDNDCDGRPDNIIDATCQCIPGQGNGPCSGNANAARCGAAGRCEPCVTDIDCALVSGGRVACAGGQCVRPLSPPGATCQANGDCQSNRCLSWFRDRDGDTVGDSADVERTCAAITGQSTPPSGYVPDEGDCCDLDGPDRAVAATIFPGQAAFFTAQQTACDDVAPFDYDCSDNVEFILEADTAEYGGSCLGIPEDDCRGAGIRMWSSGTAPACGVEGAVVLCDVSTFRGISTCQAIVGAGNVRNECH